MTTTNQDNINHGDDLSSKKKQVVYDMVQAIKEYGINQKQLLFLVKNLVVRIENVELVKELSETIAKHQQQPSSTDSEKPSVIVADKKSIVVTGNGEKKKKSLILKKD